MSPSVWASCCCAAACTTAGAIGRSAHRQWIDSLDVDARPPSAWSSTTICWRSIIWRRDCIELDAAAGGDRGDATRIGSRSGGCDASAGIDTLTAMLILAELHDFRRFTVGAAR